MRRFPPTALAALCAFVPSPARGQAPRASARPALAAAAPEQVPGDDKKAKATARIEPANPAPGADATLIVTLTIESGWHVYGSDEKDSAPTTLTLLDSGALRAVGDGLVPPGDPHDSGAGTDYWLTDTVELRHKLRVPKDASGEQRVRARIDYSACAAQCLPADSIEITATVTVAGGAESDAGAAVAKPKALAWTLRTEPTDPRPGEALDVVLSVQLAPAVTVWGRGDDKATSLTAAGTFPAVGGNRLPEGTQQRIGNATRHVLGGGFELRQAVRIPAEQPPGRVELPFELRYELQDADGALARTEALAPSVEVTAGPPRTEYLGARIRVDELQGIWGLLLAAVGAGLLALLMPCTYPMIPITVSFFTKQAQMRGGSVLPLALVYGGGIVLMFVLIGLFAAPVIVPFATHWITNAVIAAAFVVFALSLFGLVTLNPPRALMDFAGKASSKGGYLGVFLMGATLVVTSFTCTVPVAGALLSLTADGGRAYVIAGMSAFGLTMAIPFVVLSLLPGRLRAMPRAGEWMQTLKVFLGFVELAAAMKFASNVDIALHEDPRWLQRATFLWLWAGMFAIAAVYLARPLLRGQGLRSFARGAGIVFCLGFAGYSAWGALGNDYPKGDVVMPALAPPRTEDRTRHDKVKDDYGKALKRARDSGKLLLINFTGFQCVNCRLMEQNVLPAPAVAPLLERGFVEARIHTDHPDAEKGDANRKRQMRMIGFVASPYYVAVDPATERELGRFTLSNVGTDWEKLFADFLTGMLEQRR